MKTEELQYTKLNELRKEQKGSSSNIGIRTMSKHTARKSLPSTSRIKPALISEKLNEKDSSEEPSMFNKEETTLLNIESIEQFTEQRSVFATSQTEQTVSLETQILPKVTAKDSSCDTDNSLPSCSSSATKLDVVDVTNPTMNIASEVTSDKYEPSEIHIVEAKSSLDEKSANDNEPRNLEIVDEDNTKVWKNIAQDLEDISSDDFDSCLENDVVDEDLAKEDEALAVQSMMVDLEDEEPSDWEDREPLDEETIDNDLPVISSNPIEKMENQNDECVLLSSDDEGAGSSSKKKTVSDVKTKALEASDEEMDALRLENDSPVQDIELESGIEDKSVNLNIAISEVHSVSPKDAESQMDNKELPSPDNIVDNPIETNLSTVGSMSEESKELTEDLAAQGEEQINVEVPNEESYSWHPAGEVQDWEDSGEQAEGEWVEHDEQAVGEWVENGEQAEGEWVEHDEQAWEENGEQAEGEWVDQGDQVHLGEQVDVEWEKAGEQAEGEWVDHSEQNQLELDNDEAELKREDCGAQEVLKSNSEGIDNENVAQIVDKDFNKNVQAEVENTRKDDKISLPSDNFNSIEDITKDNLKERECAKVKTSINTVDQNEPVESENIQSRTSVTDSDQGSHETLDPPAVSELLQDSIVAEDDPLRDNNLYQTSPMGIRLDEYTPTAEDVVEEETVSKVLVPDVTVSDDGTKDVIMAENTPMIDEFTRDMPKIDKMVNETLVVCDLVDEGLAINDPKKPLASKGGVTLQDESSITGKNISCKLDSKEFQDERTSSPFRGDKNLQDENLPLKDKEEEYPVMDDLSQEELVIREETDPKLSLAQSESNISMISANSKTPICDNEQLEANEDKISQNSSKTRAQKSNCDSISDGTDDARLQLDFSSEEENGIPSVKSNESKDKDELTNNDFPLRKRGNDDFNLEVFVTEEIPAKKSKLEDSPMKEEKNVEVDELLEGSLADDYKPFVIPTSPRKFTLTEIETFIKERIFHYVDERNKIKMEALLEKCEQLEKQVERWKKRASYLESQVKEAEAEIEIYKQNVAANKQLQSNLPKANVDLPVPKPAPASVAFSRKSTTPVMSPQNRTYQKKTETAVKPNSGTAVPLALIANTAVTPPKQMKPAATAPKTPVPSSSKSATVIDLTEEEEERSGKAPQNAKAPNSLAQTHPSGAALLPGSPARANVSVSYQPIVSSGQVVTLPMLSGSSMVQIIPPGATTIPAGTNLAPGVRMTSNVRQTTFPNAHAGTQVAYLLQNGPGLPNQPGLPGMNRHVLTLPPQSGLIQNPRPGQMQTIFLMRNPVTSTGVPPGARYSSPPIPAMRHSVPTAASVAHVNSSGAAVNTIPVGSSGLSISLTKPQATVVPQVANLTDQRTKTRFAPPMMNLSLAGTSLTTMPNRHPAPLPPQPVYKSTPNMKQLPPRPALKISKVANGIVLSWNMTINATHAHIVSYQLYAYQESANLPSTTNWKKVGDVKALPLPMACTLTQFVEGNRYHFAVRAVDIHNRCGPYSEPTHIVLPPKK